ncbi:hypothetical protein VKS41_006595 [Umbelopsis sp. WA50703]
MDSYFHAAFTASTPYAPPPRPSISPSLTPRLPPYPPSNPEFKETEFSNPEGVWKLRNEVYSETLQPHFATGTHATIVSIKYKDSSLGPNTNLALTNSATSSVSDNLTSLTNSDKGDNATTVTAESEDDEAVADVTSALSPSLTLSPSAADEPKSSLTIPINRPHGSVQSLGYTNSPLSTSASTVGATSFGHPLPAHSNGQRSLSINTGSLFHTGSQVSLASPVAPLSLSYTNAGSHPGTEFMTAKALLSIESETTSPLSTSGNSFSALFSRSNKNNPRKPKNSITKTKSSFVSKIITNDQLAKVLSARTSDDAYFFYNVGTSFIWMDAASKPREPLSRIIFTKAHPTSHDVNLLTRGYDHLDVIIGFSSGDCIWFDPLGNKYFRLNKGGLLNSTGVTMIKWLPGSESMFMAAYQDGSILIMDKERDDQAFTPSQDEGWANQLFNVTKPHKGFKHNPVSHWQISDKAINAFAFSPDCLHVAVVGSDGLLRIIDYASERLMDTFETYYGKLTCVAWSPDGRYILTGGQDDLVTIWAFREQRIVARCQGHNSWVTGVAFDPWRCDEKVYRLASVGEDCKLIFWDFSVSALHRPRHKNRRNSMSLTSPKDSSNWRSSRVSNGFDAGVKNYMGNWSHPLTVKNENNMEEQSSNAQSVGSGSGFAFNMKRRKSSTKQHPLFLSPDSNKGIESSPTQHYRLPSVHPTPNKNQVPFLQPIAVRTIHSDPCVDIIYREDAIVTTDRRGRIRTWARPT